MIYRALFIALFTCYCVCQTTQVFYTPNNNGINTVYSLNISSTADIHLNNTLSTQSYGDGSGILGISRGSTQNTAQNKKFIFIANEVRRK